ncbi:hypothetical protein [Stenotrophomonas sp. NPDC078853]|jgi:hypothetical protein|uniref:hypothetical protein n=1 Tax=Stenotrophomonas sp. NPDC078853 TaxID=3364534 RepID=UPI00384F6BB2
MNFETDEIKMLGVYDPGVPNLERVVLRVQRDVALSSYCIITAVKADIGGGHIPMNDHFLWLGNSKLQQGDWIFVYTGPGSAQQNPLPETPHKLLSLYWGKPTTIFPDGTTLVPGLISVETARFPSGFRALQIDHNL